jgi:TolB protein
MRIQKISKAVIFILFVISSFCQKSNPSDTNNPLDQTEKIVFFSGRDGNCEIYLMNTDGSNLQRLTNNAVDDISPQISPDGTSIVFCSDRDDPNPCKCFPNCKYKIYLMNHDGSNQRRLTSRSSVENEPSWSKDGRQIAFDSDINSDGNGEIFSINLDGSGLKQLTNDNFDNRAPSWSPDGKRICYYSIRDNYSQIFILNIENKDLKQLTFGNLNSFFPKWSPDGKRITFFKMGAGIRQDIFIIDTNGTNLQQITNIPSIVDEAPSWSPDGKQIVFQSNRDNNNWEIYVMNNDGTNQRRLTNNPAGDNAPNWGIITQQK